MEQLGIVELTSLVDSASLSASTSQVFSLYRASSRLGRSISAAACFVYIASTYRSFSPSLQCRLPCLTMCERPPRLVCSHCVARLAFLSVLSV